MVTRAVRVPLPWGLNLISSEVELPKARGTLPYGLLEEQIVKETEDCILT